VEHAYIVMEPQLTLLETTIPYVFHASTTATPAFIIIAPLSVRAV
jgi:hypothetical protein